MSSSSNRLELLRQLNWIDHTRFNNAEFDPTSTYIPIFIDEPSRFSADEPQTLDHLIVGAALRNASDITLQTDLRPRVQIYGRQLIAMRRTLTETEMNLILAQLWNAADAPAILRQGRALDFSYAITIGRGQRQRFRVNATAVMKRGGDGIEITLRVLPTKTPTLDSIGFEVGLIPYLRPKSGIVVIAGATGQGKSTTMAAITRHHIETEDPKIVDLSAPIEFDYDDLFSETDERAGFIGQSEIGPGRNLPTFADGVRSALRRAPDIINVGESRDLPTMTASIEACLTGHLVNTTTHAGSVAEALRRMASVFPVQEREGRAFDLMTSLQLCVVQHLLRREGGGRVALREYLVFDDETRAEFTSRAVDEWPGLVAKIMADPGDRVARSLSQHTRQLLDVGLITETDAHRFLRVRAGSTELLPGHLD